MELGANGDETLLQWAGIGDNDDGVEIQYSEDGEQWLPLSGVPIIEEGGERFSAELAIPRNAGSPSRRHYRFATGASCPLIRIY